MSGELIIHDFAGFSIGQRQTDGFINGTAMCVAHGKEVKEWFRNKETFELFSALEESLGIKSNRGFTAIVGNKRLSASEYVELFPKLITSKRGSPENGGGVFLHPDLAMQLAQWCSPFFAIQVSRWIRE